MLPTQPACKCLKLTLETLELKPEIKPEYYQVTNVLKTQKYPVSIVSMFYFLCFYKTGNFDIIIKKNSFVFLRL